MAGLSTTSPAVATVSTSYRRVLVVLWCLLGLAVVVSWSQAADQLDDSVASSGSSRSAVAQSDGTAVDLSVVPLPVAAVVGTRPAPAATKPSGAPEPVTTEATDDPAVRTRLVVSGVGDTNLDPAYIPVFNQEGYDYAFAGLDGLFMEDDLSVVNLECAATTIGAPLAKSFTFNCDVDALDVLADQGVEVANLGNNHSGDWGPAALLDTRRNVARAGVMPVGVGENAAQAHEPAILEINGWTVAVLGFGGVVPRPDWLATDTSPGMADGDTIATMVDAVRRADEQADLVVVSIHWGVELDTMPRPEDVERAKAMIDAGADAVFGHHPHRLQPLEFYKGRPIAWSLGNFVWPRMSDAGATTAVARVVFEPDGAIDACLIPVFIERSGQPVLQGPHRQGCRPYTERTDPDVR